jgi:hypothetical protein
MTKYAFVEDSEIISIHDVLPTNWRNISNFNALTDEEEYLNSLGWYSIVKDTTPLEPETHYVAGVNYQYLNNKVVEINIISTRPLPQPPSEQEIERLLEEKWDEVRMTRDQKMKDFEWRYVRYERERRMGIPTTDDITKMDFHMKQLADIPNVATSPDNIIWPMWDN